MFNLNPLNLPDAQVQQWIMLIVAGILGFIIGYVSHKRSILELKEELATIDHDLAEYHRRRTTAVSTDDEEAVLDRIRARASEINFSRIGVASPAIADDLKEIVGIGPFLEKKLYATGIYTFRQIASLAQEDIDKINDIIEFFPGRIARDNWVGQAAELIRKNQTR